MAALSQGNPGYLFQSEEQVSRMRQLLETSTSIRSKQEIDEFIELTRDFDFVKYDILQQENGELMHRMVCENIEPCFPKKDETLFSIGDKPELIYFVLSGKIGLFCQKKDPLTGEIDPYNIEKMRDVCEGEIFGELAIISGKARIATAKCESENVVLGILTKTRHRTILLSTDSVSISKEVAYLLSIPLPLNLRERIIKLIFPKQTTLSYLRGQIAYSENSPTGQYLYLVKKGEFTKTKNSPCVIGDLEGYWQKLPDEITVNQRKASKAKSPPVQQQIPLGVVLEGNLVGETEIIHGLKTRQFTIKCTSKEGQLIILNKKDFEDILSSDQDIKEYLLQRSSTREKAEDQLLDQQKKGSVFNHLFSYQNAYKQNRVTSNSNIITMQRDQSESPQKQRNHYFALPSARNSVPSTPSSHIVNAMSATQSILPSRNPHATPSDPTLTPRMFGPSALTAASSPKFSSAQHFFSIPQTTHQSPRRTSILEKRSKAEGPTNLLTPLLQLPGLRDVSPNSRQEPPNSSRNTHQTSVKNLPPESSTPQHIDPFIKMFHKRLEYKYYQQFGKVDLTNLKKHVKINGETITKLPEKLFDEKPSLTDVRVLVEDYLFIKNNQDIKKLNQQYTAAFLNTGRKTVEQTPQSNGELLTDRQNNVQGKPQVRQNTSNSMKKIPKLNFSANTEIFRNKNKSKTIAHIVTDRSENPNNNMRNILEKVISKYGSSTNLEPASQNNLTSIQPSNAFLIKTLNRQRIQQKVPKTTERQATSRSKFKTYNQQLQTEESESIDQKSISRVKTVQNDILPNQFHVNMNKQEIQPQKKLSQNEIGLLQKKKTRIIFI